MELVCKDEDFSKVAEILGRVADNWKDDRRDEARDLVNALCSVSREVRVKVIRKSIKDVLDRVREIRECVSRGGSNCGNAIQVFLNWLDTPSGVIAYTYMWKPEFEELMVKLLVSAIFVIRTLAGGISQAK